jgi:hypothetical protein
VDPAPHVVPTERLIQSRQRNEALRQPCAAPEGFVFPAFANGVARAYASAA